MASTDQLLKELLRQFLPGFMRLFFGQAAAQIDWNRGITFRDKELFTDFPEGQRREADILAEVWTLDGTPELILVHLEVQGRRDRNFPFRMWEYYALLRLRTRLSVFPIVLYLSPGAGGITREEYREELLGEPLLTFRYGVVGLPDLAADDYLNGTEPVGWALSAGMRRGKNEARTNLLGSVVDTFLPLNRDADVEAFAALIASEVSGAEVKQVFSTFEERGEIRGKQIGVIQGQRALLTRLLSLKFGPLPEPVETRLSEIYDTPQIEALAEKMLTAQSLEELGLLPGQPQ